MTNRVEPLNFSDEARWTALAASYERWAEPLTAGFAARRRRSRAGSGTASALLDVAAGTGALTLAAAEAGARVLATDISRGMAARLRERLQPFAGSEARVMDGQALEVEGDLDVSCSVFGVTDVPDWRRGMAEHRPRDPARGPGQSWRPGRARRGQARGRSSSRPIAAPSRTRRSIRRPRA